MNKNPESLDILFAEKTSQAALQPTENVLRISYFEDRSPNHTNTLETPLYVSPLTGLDTEIWRVPSSTTNRQLESQDDQMQIFENSSDKYTYLRFICHDNDASPVNLESLTYNAYKKLFELIRTEVAPPNIIRMWNFIPKILQHQGDLVDDSERYRQFNAGRRQAWFDHSGLRLTDGHFRLPAATGIGSAGGPLVVEALLTRSDVIDIQNPRQINAYEYSPKYGSHPPMFSRATVQLTKNGGLLFIAGTASIVQEDTLHENDPAEQTRETFRNLAALISEANLQRYLPFKCQPLSVKDLTGVRVHIKRAEDFHAIKQVVEEITGNSNVCYVNDDICRDGLLVEIESNGIPLVKL